MKTSKRKKFLLVSPMVDSGPFLPLSISVISAILTNAGYDIKLFDTTFYRMNNFKSAKDLAINIGIFKPVNWDGYGMDNLKDDYIGDFKDLLLDFKPDFIGISIFTSLNAKLAFSILNAIDDRFNGKVIVGGIHTYTDLEDIKKYKKISAIIVGECDNVLLDILDFLSSDNTTGLNSVPNLIYKDTNNQWVDSEKRVIASLEDAPFLNWDYFDERNFYRPFDGKILKMGHIEMARGCPYGCTYCINEYFHKQFGNFWRVKSTDHIIEEVKYLKKKYELEAIKIWDDNFLAMDTKKILQVTSGLKEIGLKFLCHSRPEQVTDEKVRLLSENGCIQIGIGVESGNAEYRKIFLNRKMPDTKAINAFQICRKYKIISTAYCMIGLPNETKKDILQTARLLRKANPDVIVHAIFAPYKGNSLYEYAYKKGYICQDVDYTNMTSCFLKMPSISSEEVERLYKTFLFYCRFDDSLYPLIAEAGFNNEEFKKLITRLSEINR